MKVELHTKSVLEQVLAQFDFESFSIIDYISRQEEEFQEEPLGITTETADYWKGEYRKASPSSKPKVIKRMAPLIHETIHFHQLHMTTFGIWNQFDIIQTLSVFLKELNDNAWLPGKTIREHLLSLASEYSSNSTLYPIASRTKDATWGILRQPNEPSLVGYRNSQIFSMVDTSGENVSLNNKKETSINIPLMVINLRGQTIPLGVKQIVEPWAFCITRAIIGQVCGIEAATIYDNMHRDNPKYLIWDWLFEEIGCTNDMDSSGKINWLANLSTILGVFSLNGSPFEPDKKSFYPSTPDESPGRRCVDLLCDLLETKPLGEYHLLELAIMRNPTFLSSPIVTARKILHHFRSSLLDTLFTKKGPLVAALIHFTQTALTDAINVLQHTSLLFHYDEWYNRNEDYLYCPVFFHHRIVKTNGTNEQTLRSPIFTTHNKQYDFYLYYFVLLEIVRQRLGSPTAKCPLWRFRGDCDGKKGTECGVPFSKPPACLLDKQCDFAQAFQFYGTKKPESEKGKAE